MREKSILSILMDERNWIKYVVPFARATSVNAAVLLGFLIYKRNYWIEQEYHEDGRFFVTAPEIEQATALTWKEQKLAREKLVKIGWIKTDRKGTTHGVTNFELNIPAMEDYLRNQPKAPRKASSSDQKAVAKLTSDQREVDQLTKGTPTNNPILVNIERKKTEVGKTPSPPRKTLSSYSPARQKLFNDFKDLWEARFRSPYQKKDWIGPGGDWLARIEGPLDAQKYLITFFKLPLENMKGARDWSFSLFTYKYMHNELQTHFPNTKEYYIARQRERGM